MEDRKGFLRRQRLYLRRQLQRLHDALLIAEVGIATPVTAPVLGDTFLAAPAAHMGRVLHSLHSLEGIQLLRVNGILLRLLRRPPATAT